MSDKLTRSSTNRIIGGVCAGVAEHFGWDPTIVRLGFVVATAIAGGGLWVYLIAWAIIPASDGTTGVGQAKQAWDESKARRAGEGETFDPYREG